MNLGIVKFMALNDLTLFGEVDRVQVAIDRIKEHEPEEGYYLAFSGGKDSTVIYQLAKLSGVKFDAHFNNTTIDPPELVHHIRKHFPDIEEHLPKYSFFKWLEKKGMPMRQKRWCCEKLKEYGGKGRVLMTGIRGQESPRRKSRGVYETGRNLNKTYLHPIIDWDSEEVWEFIHEHNLPYCNLYDKGYSRIGCLFCPMQTRTDKKRDTETFPKQYKNFIRAFERMYEVRKDKIGMRFWKSGQECFDWWISGKGIKKYEDQTDLL